MATHTADVIDHFSPSDRPKDSFLLQPEQAEVPSWISIYLSVSVLPDLLGDNRQIAHFHFSGEPYLPRFEIPNEMYIFGMNL